MPPALLFMPSAKEISNAMRLCNQEKKENVVELQNTNSYASVLRLYWYTFYVLEAFLTMQISYRPLLWKLEEGLGLGLGSDSIRGTEALLDSLWIGLLGLEVAMVAGVIISRIIQMFSPRSRIGQKQKAL